MNLGALTIKDFINKLRASYDTCGITVFGGSYIIFNMKVDGDIFKVRIDYEESESGYVMDYKTKVLPYKN